jgi:N-acetyl-gamma-glutamyl-phosphate reductase
MKKIKVAIAGASGYAGGEALRLLVTHPGVEVVAATSEKSAGTPVSTTFPALSGLTDLIYETLDSEKLAKKAEVVFLALPHKTSAPVAAMIHEKGKKIIDLSADFRLKDAGVYKKWYGEEHSYPELIKNAIYGLPEIKGKKIKGKNIVSNPGCYPTGAILGLAPLIEEEIINLKGIVIDSKSGVTGAGRSPDIGYLFSEVNEGVKAYKVGVHRHTPEIEQELSLLAGEKVAVSFTPHLIPMDRGILTTIYTSIKKDTDDLSLLSRYKRYYSGRIFIRILDQGRFPYTKDVRGTNFCNIGLKVDNRVGRIIVITAIDNLGKGAAGQAIQNMNIMMGLDEKEGLLFPGLFP